MKQIHFPKWSRLDNTAKIFPSNSTLRDSKVFRFSCELNEAADPAVLQHALDKTLEEFPLFKSVMKKGLFWYYLEESALKAVVSPETLTPCASLYNRNSRTLLFRVVYYGRRISLEVYHVLADGTGALQFFGTMLSYYLFEKYNADFSGSFPEFVSESSQWQKEEDGFQKYYEKTRWSRPTLERNAYRLKGERFPENRLGIVEGCMNLNAVLGCARHRNVTLTELMTAVLILAIQEGMSQRDRQKPVVITVPVNLRGYFPSESARNFFEVINICYDFRKQENSMEAVLSHVKKQFQDNLRPEQMRKRMNQMCALEHSLPMRIVPLFLKDLVLRAANIFAERKATASFSNVGRVILPKGMERYVRLVSVFASPNMVQASACSFQEQYVVSFAGPFCRHDVERAFFGRLSDMGIDVTITTNLAFPEIPYKKQKNELQNRLRVRLAARIAVKKHGNPLKTVLWQVCAGSCLIFAWDYWTGFRGWSLDFVMPILHICSLVLMMILIRFLHLKPQDYLIYLGWNLLLGLIPLGLLLGGVLRVVCPSVICVLVCTVGFAALILFRGAALRAEFARRFHL